MTALVSIIIPSYNGSEFISATIDSALAQRGVRFEVIVCDDGSSDDTAARAAAFGDKVVVLRQENRGVAAARMSGVAVANGDFLVFLDQDDLLEPEFAARQLDLLQGRPELGLVYADSWIIDRADAVRGRRRQFLEYREGRVFSQLLRGNFIPIETMMLPRRVFLQVGGFRPEFRYLEDWDLCLRIARLRPVGFTPYPLARYRIHGANLSFHKEAILGEWAALLDGWIAGGTLEPAELAAARSDLALRRAELALEALKRGDRALARERRAGCGALPPRLAVEFLLLGAAQRLLPRAAFAALVARLRHRSLYGVVAGPPRNADAMAQAAPPRLASRAAWAAAEQQNSAGR